MKRFTAFFTLIIMVCMLTFVNRASAQIDYGNVFLMVKYKATLPEEGTREEMMSLLEQYVSVIKDNEKILSLKTLIHYYGNDSRDWIVITEYKSWADIDEAAKISRELVKAKWPDEEERKAFFKKMNSYFLPYHEDEILSAPPTLAFEK